MRHRGNARALWRDVSRTTGTRSVRVRLVSARSGGFRAQPAAVRAVRCAAAPRGAPSISQTTVNCDCGRHGRRPDFHAHRVPAGVSPPRLVAHRCRGEHRRRADGRRCGQGVGRICGVEYPLVTCPHLVGNARWAHGGFSRFDAADIGRVTGSNTVEQLEPGVPTADWQRTVPEIGHGGDVCSPSP